MPYILKKTKDGFKVCLKSNPSRCFSKKGLPEERAKKQMQAIAISEHKEGGKRETWTEARAREDRQYEEFKKKNEEAKAKAHERTAKEARKAKLQRLINELKTQKTALERVVNPNFQEQIMKEYNDDIEKVQNYDFYGVSNPRLRDQLDKQYMQMWENMKNRPKVYGYLPHNRDTMYSRADPRYIKEVYETYGKPEPDFLDNVAGILEGATSMFFSKVPVIGQVFDTAMDLVHGELDKEDAPRAGEEISDVNYDVLGEDVEKRLAEEGKQQETFGQQLEDVSGQLGQYEDEFKLIDTQLTPQEIGQQAQEMAGTGKPKDMELYNKIKEKVYKEQPKHSLFRSARIQKEYKDAGGTYVGDKPGNKQGLKGWFDAKWISMNDYAHDGDIVPCGSARTEERYGEYPLCRPLKVAKKIGRVKALKMLKAKEDLQEKPLHTEKILGTDKFNIKKEMAGGFKFIGDAKPLTARLGGKVLLKKAIVEKFFPPSDSYKTYVEPFVGGGSIYFYKDKDGHKEVVNDLDPLIYNIFKGFQKYDAGKIAVAVNGNYTNKDFERILEQTPKDDFQKFIKQFLVNRLSYFAKSKSFGKPRISSNFLGYQERLADTTILNEDWKSVVSKYNKGKDVFFYLDPPFAPSDSSFQYDPVDLAELKKACDAIDNKGNKFLISFPKKDGVDAMFKGYKIHFIKTKYVGNRRRGGQTVQTEEVIITNYGVSGSGKFGKSNEEKQLASGEKSSNKFMQQLEKLNIAPDDYMTVARHLAKSKGYDPDKLSFASDGDHKLVYDSPEGIRKFGKVGYGDYIIYSYLERMGKVPKGTADSKRDRFHKSHRAMSKEYGLKKYSPNELALNINW